MDDDSSAYDSAENTQATAASTNERMTAGPAMPEPFPITTKMPVPMIAPTPIAVSWVTPTAFLSSVPCSAVSWISEPTSRIANNPDLAMPFPLRRVRSPSSRVNPRASRTPS